MGTKMKASEPDPELFYPDGRPRRPGDIDCSNDLRIVKQEFRDECDVNVIIARCLKTGSPLPSFNMLEPVFADVSEMGDYRTVVERVKAADEAFMQLDVSVRGKFKNDPGLLIQFLADPANREEAVKLGLMKPLEGEASQAKPAKQEEAKPPTDVKK